MANVEVIFIQDVPGQAKFGERKKVSRTYALSVLLPRGLADLADSPRARRLLDQAVSKEQAKSLADAELQTKLLALDGHTLDFTERATSAAKLYESITAVRIAARLGVPEKVVRLPAPIKTIGFHEVELLWHGTPLSRVKVDVRGRS